jgi:hypothetical protein
MPSSALVTAERYSRYCGSDTCTSEPSLFTYQRVSTVAVNVDEPWYTSPSRANGAVYRFSRASQTFRSTASFFTAPRCLATFSRDRSAEESSGPTFTCALVRRRVSCSTAARYFRSVWYQSAARMAAGSSSSAISTGRVNPGNPPPKPSIWRVLSKV